MTTISPNYAGVNFKATEQVQPKKAETNAQSKPESKGMSNAMKVGLGLGALAAVALAGMAIKNKNAANSLTDLLKKDNINYKKIESASYEGFERAVRDFMYSSSFIPKPLSQYDCRLMSPQMTKQYIEQVAQKHGTTSKNMKIPEKGFMFSVFEDDKPIMSQFIDAEKYTDSLLDFVETSWKEGKVWQKNITIRE